MTVSTTSTPLVSIGGAPLPADVAPLLTSAVVDDSQQLPDMFSLRFRDPERVVLAKSGATIGAPVTIAVQVSGEQTPTPLLDGEVTALEVEFDAGGTFTVVRGYDQAHRLFRARSTRSYVQMTAADIATQVAQRQGYAVGPVSATPTVYPHVSQAGETDWELLRRLARDCGSEIALRDKKFSFTPPTGATGAPEPSASAAAPPLVLQLGRDLLRFRSVLTSSQQVGSVEVRGWDVATKQRLTATEPASTRTVELPTATPASVAEPFGPATHVSATVPYRTQAEVDEAARALAEELGGAFAEFEGVVRGNPEVRAGAAVGVAGLGEPFDGKYTVTTSRHRFDPATGYTTTFRVTGRSDRTLLGLASSGAPRTSAPPGVVVGQVSDAADPERQGRVRLTFPWLSDDYVSDWARTVHPGAAKDRGLVVLPEVGDEVCVAFELGDFGRPYVIGGLHNGVDTPASGPADLVDSGAGAVNRRSWVSRRGHRIDLLDADGRTEGVRLATTGDTLLLNLDSVGTTITVHADGKVLVEGSSGITIDAASAAMELKAGRIALTATSGVSVDGGAGAVSVTSGSQLSLSGAATELKGTATCSVSAPMVRIN